MSLILEALRKSDAERRLGTAPDLLAPMPVLRPPKPRRHWRFAIAGGVALLVAALVLGWWSLRGEVPSHDASATGTQHAQRPAEARVAEDAVLPAPKRQADVDSMQARVARPATVAVLDTSPAIAAPRTREIPLATRTGFPRDAPAAHIPPLNTPAAASTAGVVSATPPLVTSISATALPHAPPIPSITDAAAPTDEPMLAPLDSLSAEERNALPTLKVSMHVYANDPAQRFMIVDGQRVGEGARLAGGVTLVRIRHDGAEIDAHGMRVLLPKP